MAFDWIKLRPSLITSPRVIKMTKMIHGDSDYIYWAGSECAPGTYGPSEAASRYVTVCALAVFWSCARAHGKYVGNDFVLAQTTPEMLDSMSGVPSFHKALMAVGWAIYDESDNSVTLPNFRDYNSESTTSADRSRAYRQRLKTTRHTASQTERSRALRVTQKRRDKNRGEEKNTHPTLPGNVREQQADQMESLLNLGPKNETPHDIPDDNPGIEHDRLTLAMMALLGQTNANFKHRHREQVDNLLVEKYEPDALAALMEDCKAKKVKWATFIKKAWEIGKKPPTHLTDDDFPTYEMSEETKAMFRARGEKV